MYYWPQSQKCGFAQKKSYIRTHKVDSSQHVWTDYTQNECCLLQTQQYNVNNSPLISVPLSCDTSVNYWSVQFHVFRMDHQRIPQQALYCTRLWQRTRSIKSELEERSQQSVVQCVQLDAGSWWIKVKGQSSSSKQTLCHQKLWKKQNSSISVYDKVYRYNQYICSLLQSAVTTKYRLKVLLRG